MVALHPAMAAPLPVHVLQPEKAHCPSCYAPFEAHPAACPHCRLSIHLRAQRFPFELGELQPISDTDGRLGAAGLRKVGAARTRLQNRFPQITLYVILTQLAQGTDPREVGFWTLNAAPPGDAELRGRERRYAVLLLVDRANRKASLTLGYGLDPHLGDDSARRLLDCCRTDFTSSNYTRGTCRFIKALHRELEGAHKEAQTTARKIREGEQMQFENLA